MEIPNWSPAPPSWSDETFALLKEEPILKTPYITLENITEKSNAFPIKFAADTAKCHSLKIHTTKEILERNINSVYPVVHENILELYCDFILFKRKHGSRIEKEFYKQLSLKEFVNRLLTKRAVMFVGRFDAYILRDGTEGHGKWENIGTDKQEPPLVLQDYLSYDEIKCSAFLSVSSYTYFVNRGDRKNMAKYMEDRSNLEDEGVIIGLIGPRLVKELAMEMEEIVFTQDQNKRSNGYGTTVISCYGTATSISVHKLFSDFYEEECFDFKEVVKHKQSLPSNDQRYTTLINNYIFDNHLYYKRLTFSIDTLLMEANYRALVKGVSAYVHVVGIGLGVWKASPHQDKIYMDAFAKRIKYLGANLSNVSDICFAYIGHEECGGYKHEEIFPIDHHPQNGIKIHIYNRQPHDKLLRSSGEDKLLVVSYAWDANALPGNEYWSGCLGNSSDSATASATQITELHNPHINPMVSADNLMVVTQGGLISFGDYIEDVRMKNKFE